MKKIFCDCCGEEIRTIFKINNIEGSIILTKGHTCRVTSESDVCIYCVIDALNKLDDRPKCEPKPLLDIHIDNCNEIKDSWVKELNIALSHFDATRQASIILQKIHNFKFSK